jgi:multiple sugar transport system permease protein
MTDQIFHDSASDRAFRAKFWTGRAFLYGALILWAFLCLFPLYWTITTAFKSAPDVMKGNMFPWIDYDPKWLGFRRFGLSPDTIGDPSSIRNELINRFLNSTIIAGAASLLAVALGSLAAYGLSRFEYRFGFMKNQDIGFFFLSQLIMPPVVMALPILVMYKGLGLLDTRIGLIAIYALGVMPIVVWIMRDQFETIPTELEEAAMVDGLSIWGAFFTIILPIALPGMAAALILCVVLTWNEYFFATLLTSVHANTLPVIVASQTGSQGIDWWSMAAISFISVLPLLIAGIFLERYIVRGMAAGAIK